MSSFPLSLPCKFFQGSVLGLLASGFLAGVAVNAAPANGTANVADISFPTSRAVLWLGHTQVILLHLKTAATADTILNPVLSDPRLVEIVRAPVFLAGEQSAYLRVRGLHVGRTQLEILGGPALNIEVKPDPAEPANATVDQESRLPQIISPMPGAVVWGDFGVGVTIFDDSPTEPAEPAGKPAVAATTTTIKVQLRLPNGRLLDPVSETPPIYGPEREYQFTVPAENFPDGPLELVAVAHDDSPDSLSDGTGGGSFVSAPLSVEVKRPQAADLWTGECASPVVLGTTKTLYAPARPYHFGVQQPNVRPDPSSASGQIVEAVNRGWCLPFIVQSAGDYQMMVRARAEFACGAYPSVALYVNNTEEPSGLVRVVGTKYDRVPIGRPIHLDAGPQILSVQFKNPFGAARENRNIFLDTYELARVGDSPPAAKTAVNPDGPAPANGAHSPLPMVSMPVASSLASTAAPQVNLLYPANGAAVFGVDAVVASVSNASSSPSETVDVLLDGRLQNVPLRHPPDNAPMVFPLILRGLEPGEHRLAVRATSASGETVDSPARLLTVLAQAPAVRGPYDRAIWLLDRLAFGAEPKGLAAILTQGESKWLANRLTTPFGSPAEERVLEAACQRYPHDDSGAQTVARVLDQWIDTDNPVRARFTAWAENHFSTWMTKTRPAPKWQEHLAFCRLGIAPFSDLLEASAHSAAMLVYLDQEKNYANKINENYARAIMELHTLGVHGGYTQADVTELAKVLNGWTTMGQAELPDRNPGLRLISDNHSNEAGISQDFCFVPALNDGKPRRVLGLDFGAADPTARYDRIQLALEMLAGHPATADHVCRKLAEHYVGVPAPDALVQHLANTFLETGGDMRAVMYTMVGDPQFWSAPPKVATPFDYAMRMVRLTRAATLQAGRPPNQIVRPDVIEGFLKRSGMGLFDRVTPDGYPENSDAYADSNALLQRWRFMQTQTQALGELVPAAWRTAPPVTVADELNHLDIPDVEPGQRFVDLAAVRLTGRLLSPGSNRAALDVLGQGSPAELEQTLIFVSLMPETSLR